jgi:hypothetical protein
MLRAHPLRLVCLIYIYVFNSLFFSLSLLGCSIGFYMLQHVFSLFLRLVECSPVIFGLVFASCFHGN